MMNEAALTSHLHVPLSRVILTSMTTHTIPTRTKAPYVLVVRGEIVGYAYTIEAARKRAKRLMAGVFPVVAGKVTIPLPR